MSRDINQTKYGQIKQVNRSQKSWLQDNDIEIYSTYNEGKSLVAEIFVRTL